jgi:hypothetical protein
LLKALSLAKGLITCIEGEKNLNDLLSNQMLNVGKEGLGFVLGSNKKKNKKKNKNGLPAPHVPFDIYMLHRRGVEITKRKDLGHGD